MLPTDDGRATAFFVVSARKGTDGGNDVTVVCTNPDDGVQALDTR